VRSVLSCCFLYAPGFSHWYGNAGEYRIGQQRLGQNNTLGQGSQSGLANEVANGNVLPDCIALPAPFSPHHLVEIWVDIAAKVAEPALGQLFQGFPSQVAVTR
jgi:hypothetical protein